MTKNESHDARVLRWGGFAMAAFMIGTMMTGMARAEGEQNGHAGHRHRQPPPAAFEACKDKKAADPCEVVFGDHKVEGTCKSRDDGPLFCRPQRPPGPPPSGGRPGEDNRAP